MEISSVQNLCRYLISSAIQRCRKSDELCRLTILLKPFPQFRPPTVRISVSDTGVGINLEEYEALKFSSHPILASKWDGVISITTTSISDREVHNFSLNLKEVVPATRLTKLSSALKNGAKFSGTEASLSTAESLSDILADIRLYLQKIFIVKIPKVAVEFLVDNCSVPGLHSQNCVLAIDFSTLPSTATNIEHLKSGFEEYVLKHGNRLENICDSCFSNMSNVKVGAGMSSRSGSVPSKSQMVEAVVILSVVSEQILPSCCRPCGTRTEVLCFKDFAPCTLTQASLDALTSMKWKDYGLTLKSIADQDNAVLLEWESLQPNVHIDIVLHSYSRENISIIPRAGNKQTDRALIQKAMKLAFTELKEKNNGSLLSAHALKIQNYAPDLAKTMAGLILSSFDLDFQEECFSILGLQTQDVERSEVENCIKEKISSVVGLNDRKPQKSREPATFLFSDDCSVSEYLDEEYEEGEEMLCSFAM
ncbi:OLC1v1028301C1 [Oldenlandia corymbosa var. corymbosa]|uniref:OLC1v1028301C1 n=1 Tax=Oldenlandia corymbosa var. corymbosa TaxID=529605 RepID=A0AAV1CDB6_OLDCO|nr:OLC1v1028301C1 [Oldenlandia corymbosa var. corymbosa]